MRYTPPITGETSISSLEKINLGDREQWILLRGKNKNHPILLFLHGGPGNAQIGFAPAFQEKLEEEFLVVNWDQRGAGLSYDEEIQKSEMTIEQFVLDAYQLVNFLRDRFGQKKIFLIGHSWGSIIGMILIKQNPQLFHAYFGIGQIIQMEKGESLSYEYTLQHARKHHMTHALEELLKIGPPPYKNFFEGLLIQRKWLNEFGAVTVNHQDFLNVTLKIIESRHEYGEIDRENLLKGMSFSIVTLWPQVLKTNFFEHEMQLDLPVYFLLGEDDYNTPNSLVEEFFQHLNAPKKELVFFKDVAHNLHFEKPKEFSKIICSIADELLTLN